MKNDWMSEVSRGQTVEAIEQKPLDIRLELDDDWKLAIVLNGARVSEVDLSVLLAKKPSKNTDAQGSPLSEVDIAPAVHAVLDTQKKKKRGA